MVQNKQYQLGSWIACTRTNTISNQIDSHSIDHKSMQVLLYLIEHAGVLVTKEQIFAHVWKGKFVTEDILSVTISKLRKALGDKARSPTFIKTVPGEGYIFIAAVTQIKDDSNTEQKPLLSLSIKQAIALFLLAVALVLYYILPIENSPTQKLDINSIAVLPFDDLSSEKENQYLTDGLSDTIINQLAQIKSLKVISRYSSFTYRGEYDVKDIGAALNVDTLLDGSVQKINDQYRINVRIFSTDNGEQLWSRTFDSDSQDIFNLQDRISQDIEAIIQPITQVNRVQEKTIDPQAYEWYLLGQFHWRQRNPESLEQAITFFKRSLEIEPDYADAHTGLAISYEFMHTFGDWDEDKAVEAALPHVNRALELKPDSATALAAKGLVLTEKALYMTRSGQHNPDLYDEAQLAFARSLRLESNATTHRWYAQLLYRTENLSEVIYHMDKAIELNPLSGSLRRFYSFALRTMGKLDSAQRMFQEALKLEQGYLSQPIDSVRMKRLTVDTILDIVHWQVTNADVVNRCDSIEYCEHLAFMYLSIGADELAYNLFPNMGPLHFHFRTSLEAISNSSEGNDIDALNTIERFTRWLSNENNRLLLFDYATAQYRAGEFFASQTTLLQLFPEWASETSPAEIQVTADNHRALVLYAATLLETDAPNKGDELLKSIRTFLSQDQVFDKIEMEFTLAEVNAKLGETNQALVHLARSLEMGWIESYSQEWWALENNHLLQSLNEETEFQTLIQQHKTRKALLRDEVKQKLIED